MHLPAGSCGIGHVRYPTAGSLTAQEAQPFFVNSPLGIYLIHNGNLTNPGPLRARLSSSQSYFSRHLRTESDSEVGARMLSTLFERSCCLVIKKLACKRLAGPSASACCWPIRSCVPQHYGNSTRILACSQRQTMQKCTTECTFKTYYSDLNKSLHGQ